MAALVALVALAAPRTGTSVHALQAQQNASNTNQGEGLEASLGEY